MKLSLLLILLISCASEKPKGKTQAEVLFKEAKELVDDERFILATDKLNQLRNQFPYSYYAVPAELMLADVLFYQENYEDAATAYTMFRDFHPKHPRIHYVVFKIAESYYNQLPETYDRDLEMGVEAIKYYTELKNKYPYSKYAKEGKKKIARCKKMIREKEQYIADFYFKTELYKAAKWRYLNILDNFKNKDIRSHSIARVIETSHILKQYSFCSEFSSNYRKEITDKSVREDIEDIAKRCSRKRDTKENG